MKLLLNGTRYDYFEISMPVTRNRKKPFFVKYGFRNRLVAMLPPSPQPEIATIAIFADADKTKRISDWIFKDETLDKTEDKITINGAVMMTSYILE